MPALRLAVSGCAGRMGQRIAALALEDPAFEVTAPLEAAGHPWVGQDLGLLLGRPKPAGASVTSDAAAALQRADVLIEFTTPEVTVAHVEEAARRRVRVVVGTTGLSDHELAQIHGSAKQIPVLLSPNMSLGVNVLFELARIAAVRLGLGFDLEIIEGHHKQKKDAPSGTAKRLAQIVAEARGQTPHEVPVHAVRAGDIVGDHTVLLAGPSERLELTHRANNRDVFARGSLAAARFLMGQPAGLYDMSHVLSRAIRS